MTVHQSAVSKLLDSIEDERQLETLPIGEIEAALRALGVDPTASISLAKALAATPRPPVAALLAKIEESEAIARVEHAEAIDSKISDLGSVPTEDIRARPRNAAPLSTARTRTQVNGRFGAVSHWFRRKLRHDPRWEPGALAAHAGFCAGGGG
jgi:hypothetical protein